MKLLKSAVIAASLALSLGSFSTAAVAGCHDDAGRICVGNDQAVANIVAHIDAAIVSIDAKDAGSAIQHIKEAKRAKKEMNSEANAPKIGRLSGHFHKARKQLKNDDFANAKGELEKAKHGFLALKF
ncbi:MAG: hypothetical protein L3J75_09400 [Methylococcaceae bacterium]|nr:hypothetical protein [Methylococcaceae bacterium]